MAFRNTVPSDSGDGQPVDETYKKIRSKRNIPEIPKPYRDQAGQLVTPTFGARFYFRLTKAAEKDFGHFMQFWLVGGYDKTTKKTRTLPKVSSNPFEDFFYTNKKTGNLVLGRSASFKGCALSKLADEKHPLIALNELRQDPKGGFKANIEPVHAAFIQEIIPQKDPAGNVILENGRPKFTIDPEEKIFQFWQALWERFVDVVEPKDVTVAASDGFSSAPPVALRPKLPTSDLTKIVWYVWKAVRTENKTGNPQMDVDYHLGFSENVVLTDAECPAPNPEIGDFSRAYQTIKPEELEPMKARAEAIQRGDYQSGAASGAATSNGPSPDNPANYGPQAVGQQLPPPPQAASAAPTPAGALKPGF